MTSNESIGQQSMRAFSGGMRDVQIDVQRRLDRIVRQNTGAALEDIKPLLVRFWQRELGERLREPDLTSYAETVRQGTRIPVKIN